MSWLRLDDKFVRHPKVVQLTDAEFRVHVRVLLYCAEYETRGILPKNATEEIPGLTRKRGEKYLELGLWEQEKDGTLKVHDFDIYNPKDLAHAERQKRYRDRKRDAESDGESDGESDAEGVTPDRHGNRHGDASSRVGAGAWPVPSLKDIEVERSLGHGRGAHSVDPEIDQSEGKPGGRERAERERRRAAAERFVRMQAAEYPTLEALEQELRERGVNGDELDGLLALASELQDARS